MGGGEECSCVGCELSTPVCTCVTTRQVLIIKEVDNLSIFPQARSSHPELLFPPLRSFFHFLALYPPLRKK